MQTSGYKKYLVVFLLLFSQDVFAYQEDDDRQYYEIIELMKQTQELQTEISQINNKEAQKTVVTLGGKDSGETRLSLDDYVDDYGSPSGVIYDGSHKEIDVSKSVPITTRGEETYIGSYSSSNVIPFGRISQTLFPATIIGQRQNYGDYGVYIGAYIESDYQFWSGTPISAQAGGQYPAQGMGAYLTTAYAYFLANLGHYVTAETDIEVWQGNTYLADAFVMFGNLDTSPFFLTVGQYRPSIGSYSGGGNWTYGITTNLFRLNRVPNAALNYKEGTQTANITVFNSHNHPSFSLGYFDAREINDKLQVGFNIGYAYDISGASTPFQYIDARTGELNIDATLNITNVLPGTLSLGTSFGSTTTKNTKFNGYSDSYAGAWNTQAAYSIDIYGRGTNFNVSYGQSYNTDNLPTMMSPQEDRMVPTTGIQRQYIVSSQRAYFDNNVLIGPEYARQELYNNQYMNTFTIDVSVYV